MANTSTPVALMSLAFEMQNVLLDRSITTLLSNAKVSLLQLQVLIHLSDAEEVTMSDLSKKAGHSTAASTGLADRLEKFGYVKRRHADDDRRKVFVEITSKGRELLDEYRLAVAKRMEEVLGQKKPPLITMLLQAAASLPASQTQSAA